MAFSTVASTIAQPGSGGGTTSGIDTTGADLIVFGACTFSGADDIDSDSEGNTWTPLNNVGPDNDINVRSNYVVSPNVGASHTFTYTESNSFPTLIPTAWSGVDTADALEAQAAGAQNNGVESIQPGSITPANDGVLILTFISFENDPGNISVDSGFTILESLPGAGGVAVAGAVAYLIQSSAASVNPTWSWDGGTVDAATSMVAFNPADAGGTPVSQTKQVATESLGSAEATHQASSESLAGIAATAQVHSEVRNAWISGTVTQDGSPVESALVYIIDQATDQVHETATTDANGDYATSVLPSGTYHAVVEVSGQQAASQPDLVIP